MIFRKYFPTTNKAVGEVRVKAQPAGETTDGCSTVAPDDGYSILRAMKTQVSNFHGIIQSAAENFRSGSPVAWWTCFIVSTAAAVATRIFYLHKPNCVIWDETHFGKMVSSYINGTYFFDVHPAGGKLVLTMFAVLSGYNGTFSFFTPGQSYEGYPEILMIRLGCALLGASLAPLAFCSAWTMTRRLPSALLAATLVVAEVGTLLLTKFILLDSPLMFFMMAAFLSMCRLHNATEKCGSFSRSWWTCLLTTGLLLGCVISVKFVGLFMVGVVGLYTVHSLWGLYADTGWVSLLLHFLARVLGLIVVPVVVYCAVYALHDAILRKSDSYLYYQESTHSSGFQMRLFGSNIHNLSQPEVVAYGNRVTVRNIATGGSYLHSHNYTYPHTVMEGKKQHVTTVGSKDVNNYIRILFMEDNPDQDDGYYSGAVEPLADGDMVRLYHHATGSLIGCANNSAPVTRRHQIVFSTQTNLTDHNTDAKVDDLKYLWTVSIVRKKPHQHRIYNSPAIENSTQHFDTPQSDSDKTEDDTDHIMSQKIKALSTPIRFKCHGVRPQCYLTWTRSKLPFKWGFGQEEVSCSRQMNDLPNEWIIEENINPLLPNVSFNHIESSLGERFVESHQVMKFRNGRLKPSSEVPFPQHPWMWAVGYSIHPWFDDGFRVVLLANPIVIYINLLALIAAFGLIFWIAFCDKRDSKGTNGKEIVQLEHWCRWLMVAYLLHYLPFFTMDRILYYHHYFPALQFSSLITALLLGHWVSNLESPVLGLVCTGLLITAIMYSFSVYCFIVYGTPSSGPYNPNNATFRHLRLFDHWEI